MRSWEAVIDAVAALLPPAAHARLPYVPRDIWFAICAFLRSADFELCSTPRTTP